MPSRAAVRAQIVSFLQGTPIDQLNQVFSSFPKRINFQVGALPGQKSRAAAVVFVEDEREYRLALGGATNGVKRVDYTIVVQVFHHSLWGDATQAMDDFDVLIDGIKDRLRSDHRFGDTSGAVVWQAAEPEIEVAYGVPKSVESGATETWAGIRFTVTQVFNA